MLNLGLAAALVLTASCSPDAEEPLPEVLGAGPSEMTIAWQGAARGSGRLWFKAAGSEAEARSVEEQVGASRLHEVLIQGLEPSTRYTYWIGEGGLRYHFQTAPLPSSPFSILLVWGDVSRRLTSLLMSEVPELIVSMTGIADGAPDPLGAARPHVPVYGPAGVASPLLRRARGTEDRPRAWALDWGGLRLVICRGRPEEEIARLLDSPSAHTLGLVITGGPLDTASLGTSEPPELLSGRSPERSGGVDFVVVPDVDELVLDSGGIVHLGLPVFTRAGRPGSGAVRIDVDVEETTAHLLDSGRQVALRRPPLGRKRTCRECRQLADRGAYEKAVEAYKEFIGSNQGHFQVDDAHLAIAEILDEKLFRFRKALAWYGRLADRYPHSTLASMARQRIRYLTAHSDHDFAPLERFEKIRKVELARSKDDPEMRRRCLEEVRRVIEDYPDCSLTPIMYYWLANQYRQADPDRAVALYRKLVERFPGDEHTEDALMEIGETYYDARRWDEALAAWQEAMSRVRPSMTDAIEVQMERAGRNSRRTTLAIAGWVLLFLLSGLGLVWPPAGLEPGRLLWSTAAFVPLALLLFSAGWLVHEQFNGPGELAGLALGLPAAGALGYPFCAGLAEKLCSGREEGSRARRGLPRAVTGSLLGLVFFAAGSYVVMYHVNEHYLVVFGL